MAVYTGNDHGVDRQGRPVFWGTMGRNLVTEVGVDRTMGRNLVTEVGVDRTMAGA